MSQLFNMLSRFVIALLPRNKRLLISWLQSPPTVILEPKKIVCHCFHLSPIYLPWSEQQAIGGVLFWSEGWREEERKLVLIFRSLVSQVPSSHWTCLETICCQENQPPIPPGCAPNSVKVALSACIPPRDGELTHYQGSLFYCWRALTRRICFPNWSPPPIHPWYTYLWPLWGHRTLWPSTLFAYSFIQYNFFTENLFIFLSIIFSSIMWK